MMKQQRKTRQAKGFSLMELLLAIGIFTSVMLGILSLLQTYGEREIARATSKYMNSVMDATLQILDNPTNFNALYEAALDHGGAYQLYAAEDLAPTTVGPADNIMALPYFEVTSVSTGIVRIQGTRLLNSRFSDMSPLRTRVRILLRTANSNVTPGWTKALEIYVVTIDPRSDDIVRKAAEEGNYRGGFIRDYALKADALIENPFGTWTGILTGRLSSTAWWNSLPASLDPVTQGSYLVYYSSRNLADIASDYLYRTPDPDTTNRRLNTMYGPINLGGNDIIGVDDVNIGTGAAAMGAAIVTATGVPAQCVGTRLCVNGTAIVKGSATVQDEMTLTGSAVIADSMNTGVLDIRNAIPTANRLAYGAQGHFVVDGAEDGSGGGENDQITVTGGALFNDGATAKIGNLGTITANSMTLPQGGVLEANALTDAKKLTATKINAQRMATAGRLRVGTVQGGEVDVTATAASGLRTGIIDISDMDNLEYGTLAAPKTLTIPRMSVDSLSVTNFGACEDCPD